jgi:diguanylate cyclase (GGDEF)-like protein/PAS domain S-box-containing protein
MRHPGGGGQSEPGWVLAAMAGGARAQRDASLARNLALLYGALGSAWILVTSGIAAGMVLGITLEAGAWLEAGVGVFFVCSSAWLLYLLLDRYLRILRESQAALRLRDRAIESSVNGILIAEAAAENHPVVYANPAFERITGHPVAETLGRPWSHVLGADPGEADPVEVQAAMRERREGRALLRGRRRDGVAFWGDLHVAPVRDRDGQVTHFVGVLNDVTDSHRYQQELEHQATHDSLTDLPNRNLLRDRIQQAAVFAERYGHTVAVAFLDLDNFKLVNDSLGHATGDQLLRRVAERLTQSLRATDTVARLGGDEFVLVMQYAGRDQIPSHLHRLLQAIASPFAIEGREVYVTFSVGVAVYPEDGRDPDILLRNADAAMYQAKAQGRNNFQFFTADLNLQASERLDIATELRRALERDELLLHYQPQVELATGRVVGAEALVRWLHPSRGMVPPAKFIPVAEETGLIGTVGEWVLRHAAAQSRDWRKQGLPAVVVAVNLSARQFRDTKLAQKVREVLMEMELTPRSLELELTEGCLVHNPDEAAEMLRRLKEAGYSLAIDDFGTGYSSLSYLKRFPLDKLKIDAAFVRELPQSADSAAIVLAVISMGHSLGLRVIAEGVETAEQAEFLRRNGCDEVQGYYFGYPMSASDFAAWARERELSRS